MSTIDEPIAKTEIPTPTLQNDGYPDWKKWAWRFARSGLAGGIGSAIAQNLTLRSDLGDSRVYFLALISAFIAGFISAGMLALRDSVSQNDDTAAINKVPL